MIMVSVSSSNLAAVGYEGTTLHIRFHFSGLYAYYNVPKHVYNELMASRSHGRYFTAHIRELYGDTKIG